MTTMRHSQWISSFVERYCRYSLASSPIVMWWVSYHPISIEFPNSIFFSLHIFFYSEILLQEFSVANLPTRNWWTVSSTTSRSSLSWSRVRTASSWPWAIRDGSMGLYSMAFHKQAGLGSQNLFKHITIFNRLCVRNLLNCQEKLEVPRISLWDLEGFIPPQLHFKHPILGQVWCVMIFVPQKKTLSNSDQPTIFILGIFGQ